jgi:hypothetical protein
MKSSRMRAKTDNAKTATKLLVALTRDLATGDIWRCLGLPRCIVCLLVSGNRAIDDFMTVPRSRPG